MFERYLNNKILLRKEENLINDCCLSYNLMMIVLMRADEFLYSCHKLIGRT